MNQTLAINMCYRMCNAVAGRKVLYGRGTTTIQNLIPALAGRTQDVLDTEFGAMTKDTKDFLFSVSVLVWDDGTPFSPQVGDYIIDGVTKYEVFTPNGQDCFKYQDPDHNYIRIHTQQI